MFASRPNGKLFRRKVDEYMRNKELLVGDCLRRSVIESVHEDILNETRLYVEMEDRATAASKADIVAADLVDENDSCGASASQ